MRDQSWGSTGVENKIVWTFAICVGGNTDQRAACGSQCELRVVAHSLGHILGLVIFTDLFSADRQTFDDHASGAGNQSIQGDTQKPTLSFEWS
jgi:hypothetical protein